MHNNCTPSLVYMGETGRRLGHLFRDHLKNLRPPLLDLVLRLGCELEKMTSYAQKDLTG